MTDYTKLDAYPALTLIQGAGKTYEQGFCVMQAVAWFSGEAHTDAPECACPVLTAYAIRLNDRLPDNKRQALRALIAPLTGTRSKDHEQARAEYIVRRTAHDIVAPMFDVRWPEHAAAMRAAVTMPQLRDVMRKAKASAYADAAAASAAYAAASAASAYADADAMIEILRGAIFLGPNGGEDLTPFAGRIHEMRARGYAEA